MRDAWNAVSMELDRLPLRLAVVLALLGATFVAQVRIFNPSDPSYFLLFYPAVFACAWFGGAVAGLLATGFASLLVVWFFMGPTHTFDVETPRQWQSLVVFACMGAAFSMSRAFARAAAGRARSIMGEFDRERMKRADAERLLERLREKGQDDAERLRHELTLEIHDEIGATLTAIAMRLDAMRQGVERGRPVPAADLQDIRGLVGRAAATTREICTRLRPAILDDLGLVETCRWYLQDWDRNTGIRARGRIDDLPAPVSDELAIDLFRVFQELLTNVARHSGATAVEVRLAHAGDQLHLAVGDNGRGIPRGPLGGLGLSGIQERLRRHDGRFDIESSGKGTTARVSVPLPSAALLPD